MTELTDAKNRERIFNYVSGKMSDSEAHVFEKKMLEDPFLADAVEGYSAETLNQDQITLINLDKTIKQGSPKSKIQYWKWAAVFLIIAGSGLVIWLRIQQDNTNNILNEQVQLNPDSENNASDTTSEYAPESEKMNNLPIPQKTITQNILPQMQSVEKDKTVVNNSTNAIVSADEISAGNVASEFEPSAVRASESFLSEVPATDDNDADLILLYSPDLGEQLLEWAASFPEPELSAKTTYTEKQTEEKISTKNIKIERVPAGASTDAIQNKKSTEQLPPPSRGMIIKLIREGRMALAEQELNRMEKYYPGEPVNSVLKSALAFKKGNKSESKKSLEPLKKTQHAKLAEEFRKKIIED